MKLDEKELEFVAAVVEDGWKAPVFDRPRREKRDGPLACAGIYGLLIVRTHREAPRPREHVVLRDVGPHTVSVSWLLYQGMPVLARSRDYDMDKLPKALQPRAVIDR